MRIFAKKHPKSQEGSAAIEFALVAPVLFLFVFGIIEYGTMMFVSSVLEGATTNAARLARTGDVRNDEKDKDLASKDKSYIKDIVMQRGSGLLDRDKITVRIISSSAGSSAMGKGGELVRYEIDYAWEITTPFIRPMMGLEKNQPYVIQSSATVVNEPFDTKPTSIIP